MIKRLRFIKNTLNLNFFGNFLYHITFATTYRCNLKCKTCFIWRKPLSKELNSLEIGATFSKLKNLSWLDLTGGEVTLRDDIQEIIDNIINNCPSLLIFHITTNGQRAEHVYRMAGQILSYGLIPIISVSINGTKSVSDQITGSEYSWDKALESFKMLKKLSKGYYNLSYTLTNHNIDCVQEAIQEIKKHIPEFDFSDLHFNLFHKSPHYYDNQYVDDFDARLVKKILPVLSKTKKGNILKRLFENLYLRGVNKFSENKLRWDCHALNSSCFLDPSGNVYPCSIYDKIIGNIKDYGYDLNTIWSSKQTSGVKSEINKFLCPGCWSPCEVYPAIVGSLFKIPTFFKKELKH